ncbi:hypothetical protein HDU76_003640 [Blyttiomyces sp. JEL0837]|nr:hypothetical protein HDU76_003640 [Blyttiomyces sp. JEL0837]
MATNNNNNSYNTVVSTASASSSRHQQQGPAYTNNRTSNSTSSLLANDPTETTPLISDDNSYTHDIEPTVSAKNLWTEITALIPYSVPVSLGFWLQMSINLSASFALGHISANMLAAMTLAILYCNVTGFSLGVGMASGLDTLCSQAYGEWLAKKGEKTALGRHLSRGIVIMLSMTIPITILWCWTETLLLLAHQDPEIAKWSALYTKCLIPALFPFMIAEAIKRFLQSMGIMSAYLRVIAIVSPISMFLQYLLVWSPLKIGVIGAPLAISITWWLIAFLLVLYVTYIEGGDAYAGWEWSEAFNPSKIWIYIKLGVPGVFITCSEWWAFEITALSSGLLGPTYLAAQDVVIAACALTYMIPLGLGISATTRIGNALGANCPNRARVAAWAAFSCGLVFALGNATMLLIVKDFWGYIWTNDDEVAKIVAGILPLGALFQISDGINAVGGGVLRGTGRQDRGGYLNLVGYYVIGLPTGLYACFAMDLKLWGLWFGLATALFSVSIVQVSIIWYTNWDNAAVEAHKRSRESKIDVESTESNDE